MTVLQPRVHRDDHPETHPGRQVPPETPEDRADLHWSVHRHRDPVDGILAEVRTDGVPVGLALPADLVRRPRQEVAAAVLRVLGQAAVGAREQLEREAEDAEEFDDDDPDDPGAPPRGVFR